MSIFMYCTECDSPMEMPNDEEIIYQILSCSNCGADHHIEKEYKNELLISMLTKIKQLETKIENLTINAVLELKKE